MKENLLKTNKQTKKLPSNKGQDQRSSLGKYQICKELILILLKHFQIIEEQGSVLKSFHESTITLIPKPDKDTTKKKKITNQYL